MVYLDWNPEHFFPASARKQAFLGKFGGRRAALAPDPFAHPQSSRTSHRASLCFKSSTEELRRCRRKSGNSDGATGAKETGSEAWLAAALPFPAPLPPSRLSPGRHPDNTWWELRTPLWKDIENFKHTHLSRLPSGKVTWRCLTASVFYWSKL